MSIQRRTMLKMMGVAAAAPAALAINVNNVTASEGRKVFQEAKLGNLTLRNRIVRSATSQYRATVDGNPTDDLLRVHRELAEGGVGLIITGLTYIIKEDQYGHAGTGLYDDSQIDAYKKLTKNVHDHGAKIAVQLAIIGPHSDYRVGHREIIAPSIVTHPVYNTTPTKEMTKEDIKICIQAFADAALRAKRANFDAVELHFAHNYLVSQFLTPFFNRREDEYGGSIENRARFAFEIVDAIRAKVGPDFPVIAKVHGRDYLGIDGNSQEDNLYVAKGLAQRGVTALDISGNNLVRGSGPSYPDIHYEEDQTYFAKDAKYIGDRVDIPLIVTGGNRSPRVMEAALADNPKLQGFGFGRTLLSEPDLPNKWMKNPEYKPRCVSCNWCMVHYGKQKSQCVLNVDRAYIPAGE